GAGRRLTFMIIKIFMEALTTAGGENPGRLSSLQCSKFGQLNLVCFLESPERVVTRLSTSANRPVESD
ncbi:hypothetical protein, partial [Hyphomonas sp.]|uniref:hypothetical protein n=1 Tax=Hyphomonas sp. TaxID=87 RepID=UPI0025C44767